jgi:hypothetical protein
MKKALIHLSFLTFFKAYSQNLLSHPRILLLKNEENTNSENIKNDKNWAKIHQNIIDESDNIILLPTLERIQIDFFARNLYPKRRRGYYLFQMQKVRIQCLL